jgi:hypothetical protein
MNGGGGSVYNDEEARLQWYSSADPVSEGVLTLAELAFV